ncbi:MAG: prefoldin subunit beta [Methanomicrobiaceae archaeon]|nr:prefoldin subunit beta [Methanomicrobiaceae archaeon]
MNNIPPKVQNQLVMLQQIQQQLQTVVTQKAQFEMAVKEAKRAHEELKDVSDDSEVFVNIGSVLMQQDRQKVLSSLEEKVETLELRIKSLEKQETALTGKFEQLQAQVKSALEGGAPPTAT